MHYVIISGSHRHGSESGRVARYLQKRMAALDIEAEADIIDLAGNPLPLWDGSFWSPEETDLKKLWQPYRERLQKADGLVMIAPEWSGSVAPGLKNFLLFCNNDELKHKPAMLVGVSSTRGGAYPVAELRATSTKNTKMVYIPNHVLIRNVGDMLQADTPTNTDDEYIRGRLDFSLQALAEYANALVSVRKSAIYQDSRYQNGM